MNAEQLEQWVARNEFDAYGSDHCGEPSGFQTEAVPVSDLRVLFDGKVLVPVDDLADILDVVRDALHRAYNNATPVCCGRLGQECCGNPDPEWSAEDSAIMESLGPIEKSITALLAAAKEKGE
jgi:hypothetical protein